MTLLDKQEVIKNFPAPEFRRFQKETLIQITTLINSGYKVILLDAPTGSGKSLINSTFCKMFKSFYVTPQLTLIDQIKSDTLLKYIFTEIKGRENYTCIKDVFMSTVKEGVCRRDPDFKCDKIHECPYYSQKWRAINSDSVLTSFAYFILEGQLPEDVEFRLGNRDLTVLDESHSIDRYVIDHINLQVNPFRLPKEFYDEIKKDFKDFTSIDEVAGFIKDIRNLAKGYSEGYEQFTLEGLKISVKDVRNKDRYDDFVKKADRFLKTVSSAEWVHQINWVTYRNEKYRSLLTQPVYAKEFMKDMLWNRANLFIISSATILSSEIFIRETGLDKAFKLNQVYHLKVPSTFPPENRPIINLSSGKMRRDMIEDNLPRAVYMLENIIEHEKEKNIAVHCNSYRIAEAVLKLISPRYKPLIISHEVADRNNALEEWKNSKGKVFICVAFEEGQDWKGDYCGAQVMMKCPFPDTTDRRVARRLEHNAWNWYFLECLKKTIQEYGRAVRSETEKKNFYVLDASFESLIKRTRKWLPSWFSEALPEGLRK